MLTRLSKFSKEFPQLKGFGLITHVNIHSQMRAVLYLRTQAFKSSNQQICYFKTSLINYLIVN